MPNSTIWTRKNRMLAAILGVLILLNLVFFLWPTPGNINNRDRNLFMVADTSSIVSLQFSTEQELKIEKNNLGDWQLNERFKVDEYYRSLLFALLSSIQVQREVGQVELQSVKENMAHAVGISIVFGDGREMKFRAGGNEQQTISYFMQNGRTYVVHIPGYTSYVSGIFGLSENEWRDKTLFRTNWSALRSLAVNYPDQPEDNFTIASSNGFLAIDGISQLDTTRMMDYVEMFSGMAANYFFDSNEPGIDSILTQEPYMSIALNELDTIKNNQVRFYPRDPQSNIQIGQTQDGQVFGFDYRNMQFLERKLYYFQKEAN